MAKTGSRVLITLVCTECKERNYHSQKNRRNTTDRDELVKFCNSPKCRKRALHRESWLCLQIIKLHQGIQDLRYQNPLD